MLFQGCPACRLQAVCGSGWLWIQPNTKLNLLKALWDFFVITCHNVCNVWPKTTLLLPVWPRDAKILDIPFHNDWIVTLSILLLCLPRSLKFPQESYINNLAEEVDNKQGNNGDRDHFKINWKLFHLEYSRIREMPTGRKRVTG